MPRTERGPSDARHSGSSTGSLEPQRDRRASFQGRPARPSSDRGASQGSRDRRPNPSPRPQQARDAQDASRDLASGSAEQELPRSAQPAVSEQDVSDSPFTKLGLVAPLVQAVLQEGYSTPTPIQEQTIPTVLEGRDLLGCAQTGTGKTAAFMLPLLQRLGRVQASGRVRALVLSPTRELAAQISERAGAYGRHFGIRHAVIYGGVSQRAQERELARRPDLLVATPGRLMDLMRQGHVQLKNLEILVLDEADTMLDMGFIHDVRRIIAQVPQARQTLLFSATMPAAIESLARSILNDPARVSVTPQATTAETVEQAVYFVSKPDKRFLLERVLRMNGVERALVFTRTKHGADRVSKQLVHAGIEAAAIHGNKSQNARERALDGFRRGTTPVLVATDIAARGIDVQGISHVINYDLPNVAESYVHRIGRTGRAGAVGRAISFCDQEERSLLVDIERLIRQRIRVGDAVPRGSDTAAIVEVADPRPPFDPERAVSQNSAGGGSGRPFRSTQRRPTHFRPRSGHS